jgi:hypothetical protein
MFFATIYVHSPQTKATGGLADPLNQFAPRNEPAALAVKFSDPEDYDHVRWEVPEGDDYSGVIYDKKNEVWVEGPPPARQYGFVIGPETLKELGVRIDGVDVLSRSKGLEVHELIEGALRPAPQ